ncbi:type I-B CRISPR-associated protein Cas5b [Crassaminicella indica]|uniref:type I-B CRISPR-associated protein Cas5b n=1 Tax=Crassaminicella indica TaxID=2855394 RepID=UPI0021083F52|nr:type I-B CRISPR-associated protein Cas5b [Crassaminicella indica]
MKLLKFNLHGKTAHFKKPDVNAYAYYTYSHIHKIALYGIIGAILGLGGYTQQQNKQYPEFYDLLKDVRVGIVPIGKERGYFSKKMITFNNSVGYANIGADKAPCNLVVREQWLEDVSWDIYIALDDLKDYELKEKMIDYILNSKAEFLPYLGKNDHIANICNTQLIECEITEAAEQIHSLFYYDEIELEDGAVDEDQIPYLFKDYMPVALNKENNMYEFAQIAFTNRAIEDVKDQTIILDTDKYIALL